MANLDLQFEDFMKEPLSTGESPDTNSSPGQEANLNEELPVPRQFWWVKERPRTETAHTDVASIRTCFSEASEDGPLVEGGGATIAPTVNANVTEVHVISSPDISSSMAEFLEKEKLCKELSSSISEVDSPGMDLEFPSDDVTDDEIGSIMEQLSQLAGSADDSAADKSVEDILKEAVQLVRDTSHSFSGLGDHSELFISPVEEGLVIRGPTVNPVPSSSTSKKTKSKHFITEEKGKTGHSNITRTHTVSTSRRKVESKSSSWKAGDSGEQFQRSRLGSVKVNCRKTDTRLGMQETGFEKFGDLKNVTCSGTHVNIGASTGDGRTKVGTVIDAKSVKHFGSSSGNVSKRKGFLKKEKTVSFEDDLSLFPKSPRNISKKQENVLQTSNQVLQQEESISKGKLDTVSKDKDDLLVFKSFTQQQSIEDGLSVRKEKHGDHLTKVLSVSPPSFQHGDIVGIPDAVFQPIDNEARSEKGAALQESEKSSSQLCDHSLLNIQKEIDKRFGHNDTTGSTMLASPDVVGTSFCRKSLSLVLEESSVSEPSSRVENLRDVGTMTGELPRRQSSDRCIQVTDSSLVEHVTNLEKELLQERNVSLHLKAKLESEEQEHGKKLNVLKCQHEEEMFTLKKDLYVLNAKISDLKKQQQNHVLDDRPGDDHIHDFAAQEHRITLLEAELQQQEQLMLGYQHENDKLCQAMKQLKEELKTKEQGFAAERQHLLSLKQGEEVERLSERLKDKEEAIVQLQIEVHSLRDKNKILEQNAEELKLSTAVLQTEVEKQKRVVVSTAEPALKITPGNHEVHRVKEELSKREMELNKILKEFQCSQKEMATAQAEVANCKFKVGALETKVLELQTLLTKERAQNQALSLKTEEDKRKVQDLNRQVKEMEHILKRNHPNSISALILAANSEGGDPSPRFKYFESRVQQLEEELAKSKADAQAGIREMQDKFQAMKLKYEEHTSDLELQLASVKHQAHMWRQAAEKKAEEHSVQDTKPSKRTAAPPMVITVGAPPANALAVREDAHLLATIRGLKQELAAKDKELVKVRRDLDESAKTNRKLQKERAHQLVVGVAPPRPPAVKGAAIEHLSETSQRSGSNVYDPSRFEPSHPGRQEDIKRLEQENGMLREKMLHLEEDYRGLQEKRLQDLNILQEQHEVDFERLVSDHVARHSNSRIASLQGQLSTQQIIIGHLKDRLKLLDEYQEEIEMLKAERDHLERSNMDLMKKVSDFQSMQTPEMLQYEVLQEKLSELERRHTTREEKLQAIVRDLLRRSAGQQALTVEDRNATSMREKLLNKNRQLCLYRAEMDRILETLREFSMNKKLGSMLHLAPD